MIKGCEQGLKNGRKEGIGKWTEMIVRNLLATNVHTIAKISDIVGVSQAFVRKVKKSVIVG